MTVKLSGPRIVLQTLRYGVRYGSRYVALRRVTALLMSHVPARATSVMLMAIIQP